MITLKEITPKFLEKLIEEDRLIFNFYYYGPNTEYRQSGPVYSIVEDDCDLMFRLQPFKKIVIVDVQCPTSGWRRPVNGLYDMLKDYHNLPKQKLKRLLEEKEI